MNISELDKPYVIAEIGCNHNGNTELGLKMVDAAYECGASAVKFQFFTQNNLFTEDYLDELDSGVVKLENVDKWENKDLGLTNIKEQISAFTNDGAQLALFREHCKEIGIDFGCTPVDKDGVRFLSSIDSDFIKISSMDANNLDIINECISADIPVIVSTGMATLQEIDRIYNLFKERNCSNFSILHCVSIYPPRDEIINLNFIDTLKGFYECEIGYSDHSLGFSLPIAAVAKGAKIIEKHFTLDKKMSGWDHRVSADKDELKVICDECNKVYSSLGSKYKTLSLDEIEKRKKFRRSMVAACDLKEGMPLKVDDFVYKRPGTGVGPDEEEFYIGKILSKNIKKDATIFKDHFI